jgi:hypothetical protein
MRSGNVSRSDGPQEPPVAHATPLGAEQRAVLSEAYALLRAIAARQLPPEPESTDDQKTGQQLAA